MLINPTILAYEIAARRTLPAVASRPGGSADAGKRVTRRTSGSSHH